MANKPPKSLSVINLGLLLRILRMDPSQSVIIEETDTGGVTFELVSPEMAARLRALTPAQRIGLVAGELQRDQVPPPAEVPPAPPPAPPVTPTPKPEPEPEQPTEAVTEQLTEVVQEAASSDAKEDEAEDEVTPAREALAGRLLADFEAKPHDSFVNRESRLGDKSGKLRAALRLLISRGKIRALPTQGGGRNTYELVTEMPKVTHAGKRGVDRLLRDMLQYPGHAIWRRCERLKMDARQAALSAHYLVGMGCAVNEGTDAHPSFRATGQPLVGDVERGLSEFQTKLLAHLRANGEAGLNIKEAAALKGINALRGVIGEHFNFFIDLQLARRSAKRGPVSRWWATEKPAALPAPIPPQRRNIGDQEHFLERLAERVPDRQQQQLAMRIYYHSAIAARVIAERAPGAESARVPLSADERPAYLIINSDGRCVTALAPEMSSEGEPLIPYAAFDAPISLAEASAAGANQQAGEGWREEIRTLIRAVMATEKGGIGKEATIGRVRKNNVRVRLVFNEMVRSGEILPAGKGCFHLSTTWTPTVPEHQPETPISQAAAPRKDRPANLSPELLLRMSEDAMKEGDFAEAVGAAREALGVLGKGYLLASYGEKATRENARLLLGALRLEMATPDQSAAAAAEAQPEPEPEPEDKGSEPTRTLLLVGAPGTQERDLARRARSAGFKLVLVPKGQDRGQLGVKADVLMQYGRQVSGAQSKYLRSYEAELNLRTFVVATGDVRGFSRALHTVSARVQEPAQEPAAAEHVTH